MALGRNGNTLKVQINYYCQPVGLHMQTHFDLAKVPANYSRKIAKRLEWGSYLKT